MEQFPNVALSDVYPIIAHYLTRGDRCLPFPTSDQGGGTATRTETRFNPAGIRAHLLACQSGAC